MHSEAIREWAEEWVEIPPTWSIDGSELSFAFGEGSPRLRLGGAELASWAHGSLPKHRELKYVPHCGIELIDYAEYIVDLEHIGQWPRDKPLRFRVGPAIVCLGPISAGLSLVLEPYYKIKEAFQDEFYESLSSLQIVGSLEPRRDALSALFYLNADYLRPARASARIAHLLDPQSRAVTDGFEPQIRSRKRVRHREPLEALEPVRLFISAAASTGEARFLGFYRVLEYFFARARAQELSIVRRDLSVADSTFFKKIKDETGELPQLRAVVRSALRPKEAESVVRYVNYHRLAKCASVDDASNALYAYRNAMIHAKEAEMSRTVLPDPFMDQGSDDKWNWVVELIAEKCNRRLNVRPAP